MLFAQCLVYVEEIKRKKYVNMDNILCQHFFWMIFIKQCLTDITSIRVLSDG